MNRDYQIADFLVNSSAADDRVFIWDPDAPSIYALSKRLPPTKYVVPYHVNDYSSREAEAEKIGLSLPKFIILTNNYSYDELETLVKNKYLLINQIGDANIYSRIDFAPTK
jgi:hypothetical protein